MFYLGDIIFLQFNVLPLMDRGVSRYQAWLLAFHLQCHGHQWEHEALFCSSAQYICQGCHGPCRIPPSIHHFDDSLDGAQVLWHQVVRLEGVKKVFTIYLGWSPGFVSPLIRWEYQVILWTLKWSYVCHFTCTSDLCLRIHFLQVWFHLLLK